MLQSAVYISADDRYKAEIQFCGRRQWRVGLYAWHTQRAGVRAAQHVGWVKTGENLERTLTAAQAVARKWTAR